MAKGRGEKKTQRRAEQGGEGKSKKWSHQKQAAPHTHTESYILPQPAGSLNKLLHMQTAALRKQTKKKKHRIFFVSQTQIYPSITQKMHQQNLRHRTPPAALTLLSCACCRLHTANHSQRNSICTQQGCQEGQFLAWTAVPTCVYIHKAAVLPTKL